MDATAGLLPWLLEGDPSVRWRALAMTGATPAQVRQARHRVATDGWGARLLALQSSDGGWGRGVYSPKWTSTTYTLLHLMWLGLPAGNASAHRGLQQMWAWQRGWRVPETCIASILVRLTCSFDYPASGVDEVVGDLLEQQQDDGGWNCDTRTDRTKHSSFHTSIQVLEALRAYEVSGGHLDTGAAQHRGRQFFLEHRLFRSHRTGAVAIRGSTRFPAFPEWHFDVLRGLEHFADVGAKPDDRLSDAVDVLLRARRADGRWPTYAPYPSRAGQWFELEPAGASRWNSARVLRVLTWWGHPAGDRNVPTAPAP
jgi:hypothetical protein